ncbi:ATP-binding protein [Pararhodobacter sp. SW119]|uniref:sensor histidine kinase n=1 Tax=Pararhodobacter sp. SW119 TaxID=2780075 RepID=UPI001AE00BAD|nr:ATP-binding protein [Pararhodobacter sp. SW119]
MSAPTAPPLRPAPARLHGPMALLGALGLILALGLGAWGYDQQRRAALMELSQRGESTLNLAVAVLRGQLERYRRLPGLIAQQPQLRRILADPRDPDTVQATNAFLQATNRLLQSSDIYVMGLDGTTLAASNFDAPHSFVGGNFAFRPYFQDALTRGEGRFFALGTTSLVRGYYFGAPVRDQDAIAGVVVFKVDLDAIEESWRGSDYEVIVTDPEGIVFMSSHPDWTYAATLPLTAERRARTEATRRYADTDLRALALARHDGPGGMPHWRIDGQDYMVLSQPMPEADWTVHVLTATAGATVQAATRVAVAALLAGLAVLAAVILLQRRARMTERLALQAEAQAELERRVTARTTELASVNRQLEAEVAERRAAETRLRATQDELIQAGKLAALGQMSAALSHEFNQPLGAARNYAENAQLLMDRGRIAEARGNIDRIFDLIERMGAIARHLRNFARKPNARLSDVPLAEAVAAVQELLGWRLAAERVTLQVDLGAAPPVLRAGPVRLQQVLVNILTNAMDAMDAAAQKDTATERRITLTARRDGANAVIRIADTGAGIAPALIPRIFDPFFSTKGPGKGLGLGLSISYNIVHDFGGTLTADNAPEGGAVFVLVVPLAEADHRDAA